ncbi:hypothetical protein PG911_07390 [Tenacibaculum ovolyticum]|uniref:hypothetical protein n=1 Tax=Tenacibaculum ovolyticum TaxID=104270 RepID=UPI0022F3E1DE|nr:hypothetical protein [Tenacibaculum ovolyticum]WBX78070.1 hypothetical protein PG911_07390 [Tenacibaculum ovolyticum]
MDESLFIKNETKKYTSQYGEVPPKWIFRPESHPYSIGWRQGSGETFSEVYYIWFERNLVTEKERIKYFLKYSPPPRWLATVIEDIWELEGWNEPYFDYSPYLKKLKNLGFDGTEEYEKDLTDEKWLDKF